MASPGSDSTSLAADMASPGSDSTSLGLDKASPGSHRASLGLDSASPGSHKVGLGVFKEFLDRRGPKNGWGHAIHTQGRVVNGLCIGGRGGPQVGPTRFMGSRRAWFNFQDGFTLYLAISINRALSSRTLMSRNDDSFDYSSAGPQPRPGV